LGAPKGREVENSVARALVDDLGPSHRGQKENKRSCVRVDRIESNEQPRKEKDFARFTRRSINGLRGRRSYRYIHKVVCTTTTKRREEGGKKGLVSKGRVKEGGTKT